MSSRKTKKHKEKIVLSSYLFLSGLILLFIGFLIAFLTFFPVLKEEIKYLFRNKSVKILVTDSRNVQTKEQVLNPVDDNFGIVIPKILANAKVIDNVDPYDSHDYQVALTKGVAHARGTALPGHSGNDFIFAHSSGNWYDANRYNSVFYLLHKLEKGDEIYLFYQKNKYLYKVTEKVFADQSDVGFLSPRTKDNSSVLTLMTCWPPGTTLKRLIIKAALVK